MAPRQKFTIDTITGFLDRYPCSAPGAALLTLYSYYTARNISGPSLSLLDHVKSNKWLTYLLALVVAKTLNRSLTRLVRNQGWKADPPKWSRVKGQGDVVLITGGAGGIGKEFVDVLAKKTDKIAVLDMAKPTYLARNVKWYECDVTDPKNIAEVAKQVRIDLGHPTIIINNAGIARGNTILDTTPEQFLLTYKVNVLGCHNILREFLPHLIKINHGHVMTVASSASYMALPQLSEYACSKAAALALHECLTAELVHRYNAPKVRTSVICPTKVATQMGNAMEEQENQFMFPTLTPEWLGAKMVEIVESGLSDHLIAPGFAALTLPSVRSAPEWFRWIVNTAGKTHNTITDARNANQRKVYTFVDALDAKHGLSKMA